MDDGYGYQNDHNRAYKFSTHSFPKEDQAGEARLKYLYKL